MPNTPHYIGMDLGTFKTSIAASNGKRAVLATAVGWPKDLVAKKMLGHDLAFGDEVFEHRLALEVCRPFAKGALKYGKTDEATLATESAQRSREAARLLVEHAIALTDPPVGAPIFAVVGAPSFATDGNKQIILECTSSCDSVMIAPEPFVVAYGMNLLADTVVVDIGAGTIDLCAMHGSFPTETDQVTIPIGGDMIDEAFYCNLCETYPDVRLSLAMARKIKEKYGFVHDVDEHAVVSILKGGKPQSINVTAPLKAACQSIVQPILHGLEQLITNCDPEFQQSAMKKILLAGGGSQLHGLDRMIEEGMAPFAAPQVTRTQDCVYAGADGALKLAMEMPASHWDQMQNQNAVQAA